MEVAQVQSQRLINKELSRTGLTRGDFTDDFLNCARQIQSAKHWYIGIQFRFLWSTENNKLMTKADLGR